MSQPSAQEIQVATGALRTEGQLWQTEGDACGVLAGKVEGLSRTRLQAGIFQLYIGPYQEVCTLVTTVLAEGDTAMGNIGTTLIDSATMYDQEEANNTHLAQQTW